MIGRTLRGTLGDRFRDLAVERFERMHGAGPAPVTSLSRTVELTVAAVTRAGEVRVDATIADPVFGAGTASVPAGDGWQSVSVVAESLAGIRPVSGPPGADRSRTITVAILASEPALVSFLVLPEFSLA